jgi:hypothetical protein
MVLASREIFDRHRIAVFARLRPDLSLLRTKMMPFVPRFRVIPV